MAAVAVLTSLAAAAGPLGGLLGFLGSLAYFLVATMARTANLFELVSLRWAAPHIAVGCVAGLLVVFVGTAWRRPSEPDELKAARAPVPLKPVWVSLRSFDEHARDGVRRTIPLAILISDRIVTKRLGSRETAAFVRLRLANRGRSTARNVAVSVLKVHRWNPVSAEWVRPRPELDGRLLQPSNQLASKPDLVDVFPYSDRIVHGPSPEISQPPADATRLDEVPS
jgi:hypothetical protein